MSNAVSSRTAWWLLGGLVVFWGGNWPVMKTGLAHLPPLTFASIRMITSVGTMFILAGLLGELRLPARRDWGFLFLAGALQMGLYIAMLTYGMQYVEAGRSSILAYTMPVWVVPGAILFLGERLNGFKALGFLLGLGGLMVLFSPASFDWTDRDVLLGNGLILGGAAIGGMVMLHIRGRTWHASPLSLAPWQFVVATAVVVPMALVMEPDIRIEWTPELIGVVAYNGPLATALGLWAFVAIGRALPAITASMGLLGVPVAGLLLSAAILGETITPTNATGLALIVASVATTALGDRKF
ncbi:MAG: DMT family transporter [Pseudomonadota bacterium]|nr:DMT family transporter [Pseudomonadota bacterium]